MPLQPFLDKTFSDYGDNPQIKPSAVSGVLPSQAGHAGQYLKTDGASTSWADAGGGLPSQSGNSGKLLTTDGTNASWTMYMKKLTQAEYDVLPQAEKTNGTIYMIVG